MTTKYGRLSWILGQKKDAGGKIGKIPVGM